MAEPNQHAVAHNLRKLPRRVVAVCGPSAGDVTPRGPGDAEPGVVLGRSPMCRVRPNPD